MRESCTSGSVRGAHGETRVPTATGRRQAKLARSAGASPAQVRPSKSPGEFSCTDLCGGREVTRVPTATFVESGLARARNVNVHRSAMARFGSPIDPRIKYTRKLTWEDCAMSSDLTELGQEAIAAVSRGVTDGAPLVKCQLLASAFYEALRHELRKADATKRGTLLAVTHQCHRSAAANISPVQALHELKRAIDLLQPVTPASETVQPLPRSRPVLRVIQGGLSSS